MTREFELYNTWIGSVEECHRKELEEIRDNAGEIQDRFYRDLEFGTAGLRGVLGLGTNRMNIYTVRRATQGLAEYLLETTKGQPSAAIAYDSRILSDVFARETACVLAANGVKVHLYRELMPTPALSYAVRELGCDSGVVITASHNPAKYNGYKAYGSDGCQIGPVEAERVLELIGKVDIFAGVKSVDFDAALTSGAIAYIPETFVQQYINRVFEEAIQPEICAKAGLKLVYTPLNGAGNRCVRTVLDKAGVKDITVVPQQEKPDGNFPTCPYPNPETKEALELGFALCKETGADLLLATDPDCDRVAAAARRGEEYRILSGNEIGVLLLDYIAQAKKDKGQLPARPVAVKSIVSTKMADAVAAAHGVEMVDVLTGFKYIGEVIYGLEQKGEVDRYLLGFEESCGYLTGPYVRDKDAVDASLLLVEMASAYKLQGKTLLDVLDALYERHGYYSSQVSSYAFEGADGMKRMADIMSGLRKTTLTEIAGDRVAAAIDYQRSVRITPSGEEAISQHKADVLEYCMENGCSIIVRPSGTEPKIKLYYLLTAKDPRQLERLNDGYARFMGQLIGV